MSEKGSPSAGQWLLKRLVVAGERCFRRESGDLEGVQRRVVRYAPGLAFLRHLYDAVSWFRGGMRLPQAGGLLAYRALHGIAVRNNDPDLMPQAGESSPPGGGSLLWHRLRDRPEREPSPRWLVSGNARGDQPCLAVTWASRRETRAMERNAEAQDVSLTVFLLWTLHQAVARRLIDGERGSWIFPVKLRGPAHPVSTGALIWNGRLTLTLQLDPVLGADRTLAEQCLRDWRRCLLVPEEGARAA